MVMALNKTTYGSGNKINFGGLSAESTDIAEANKTDLSHDMNSNNSADFGGLSAGSVNNTK
jgi:hypothetical protein